LVLCAVYIPTTFISGLQGSFYQQFSITIAPRQRDLGVCLVDAVTGSRGTLWKPHSHEPQPTLAHQVAALPCGDCLPGQLGLRVAVIRPWLAGEPMAIA
jgi:hypothetical protein